MAAFLSSKLKEEEKPRFDTTDCVNGGEQRNGERRGREGKENQGVAEENRMEVRGEMLGI